MNSASPPSRWPLVAAGLFLAANLAVPLAFGDLYPFTSAPMFRDCPERCCNYRVYAADGSELPAEDWLLQRIYDGNPVGYGVGRCPPAVIEQQFGVVCDEAAVRTHIQRQFAQPQHARHSSVEVVQETIGPLPSSERVGVLETRRWRIERPQ